MAAFLPHQAYLTLDAIVRVLLSAVVQQRHLLEWQTAEMSHLAAPSHLDAYRAQFFLISALAAVFLLALNLRGFSGTRRGSRFSSFGLPRPLFSTGSAGNAARSGSRRRSTLTINAISAASRAKPGATSMTWSDRNTTGSRRTILRKRCASKPPTAPRRPTSECG